MKYIADRCHRVFWLNTDERSKWNQGDSIIGAYESAGTEVHGIRTAGDLIGFLGNLSLSRSQGQDYPVLKNNKRRQGISWRKKRGGYILCLEIRIEDACFLIRRQAVFFLQKLSSFSIFLGRNA